MKALAALIVGLAREFVRDRTALFFTLIFPLIFMVIFGLLMQGLDRPRDFDIGMVVEDRSEAARGVAAALRSLPIFKVTEDGAEEERAALRDGDRDAVLVLPAGFGDSLQQGKAARVQVLHDPSRVTTVQIVMPILSRVLDDIDRARSGTSRGLDLEPVTMSAQNLRTIDFMAPGIIAMSVMQLGVFSSINLVSKREKLILKRFGATPLRRGSIVAAEVLFRLVVTAVQVALQLAIASLAFQVPINGSVVQLLGLLAVGALAFIGIGFAISSFARTEEGMLPIAQLVSLPMMFLSGVFFPVDGMPAFLQPLVKVLPLTFLGDGVRQAMVSGFALNAMWLNFAVLAAWLAVSFSVAVRFFKWE